MTYSRAEISRGLPLLGLFVLFLSLWFDVRRDCSGCPSRLTHWGNFCADFSVFSSPSPFSPSSPACHHVWHVYVFIVLSAYILLTKSSVLFFRLPYNDGLKAQLAYPTIVAKGILIAYCNLVTMQSV